MHVIFALRVIGDVCGQFGARTRCAVVVSDFFRTACGCVCIQNLFRLASVARVAQ
jgi:hypothetical protein